MPSEYFFRTNLSNGFRTKLYTNIKGFELTRRLAAASDCPPQELEVVFITGNDSITTHNTIDRFAHAFGFSHIHVPGYLCTVAAKHDGTRETLGSLHPASLQHMLAAGEKVPTYFVLQILERCIHHHVQAGQTKFLISGLDGDAETAAKFPREIAQISAVISLVKPQVESHIQNQFSDLRIEDIRAAIEEHYRKILLEIDLTGANTVDEEYIMLLGAIAKRAFEG
ncbi:hypothetical protein KC343_g13203 [Hortaea werneckii]|uniref:Uncharacterized protein n=1 Tax=Hortaea werneckii TaxID=91943 RepID=A0A3M7F9Y2_HORWE|nr:hypothetical protein KC338_g2815 [Hortaea werneckii]KAI7117481.1 hypothetical protein KC352_g33788 [Hortaea werneckii]KAI7355215.1 hypothetical protein KC320_g2927 [Hortaea werneckii]KAI7571312.1 hypothetical protein KC317_g1728 [Hortaea werneckii]KAI7589525.1 hypothetical protein KC346_g16775 [Hortaea werneckii]